MLKLILSLIIPITTALAQLPGPRPDGSMLLPNQWSLRPAGQQIPLGDFPVNIAIHPQGRYAAILHCGYSQHAIMIVDLKGPTVLTNAPVEDAFYGIEFSRAGTRLYCSGASGEVVHQFQFKDGTLSDHQEIRLRDAKTTGVPSGIAVGTRELWVANLMGQSLSRVSLETNAVTDIPVTSVKVDTNNVADDEHPATIETTVNRNGPLPYACRLDEQTQRLYVSLWGEGAVAVVDVKTQKVVAHWPTQEQPNEMLLTRNGKLLFVANANRNTVTILDTATGKAIETLVGALYPNAPAGSTPNSLALSADERTLFVANADNNNLAVFDVSKPGHSRSLGFIPVGWYPTSVRVTPDGKKLLVANGKGGRSIANPSGPAPGKKTKAQTIKEYIAQLLQGTLSVIDMPSTKQMADYTATAFQCSPLKRDAVTNTLDRKSVV
jgi:DNA-binding beta-propeller fold protein YncE